MKVAITGAVGQLGSYLCEHLPFTIIPITRGDLNIMSLNEIGPYIKDLKPDVLINCAAFTRVDDAESDRLHCYRVNSTAVATMATACKTIGAKLVQVSTDYVFDGSSERAYIESDEPNPRSIYGSSKSLAESDVKRILGDDALVVRTCGLYDNKHRNFLTTILDQARTHGVVKVVNDQTCTPTHIPDFCDAICKLLDKRAVGIYHFTNSGCCSWFCFAEYAIEFCRIKASVKPISTRDFEREFYRVRGKPWAFRPPYSVLNCEKYQSECQHEPRYWNEALEECLNPP